MKTHKFLIAGFGGQGILFTGKLLAYIGMIKDKQITWLPSYGPEMRGGTANCSVIISDTSIGSPIVNNPQVLIVMNLPSLEKFEDAVKKGGKIFIDSSLIHKEVTRTDVEEFRIPSTQLAVDNDMPTLANMIMFGYILAKTQICTFDELLTALKKVIPERKADMLAINQKALEIGFHYN